MNDDVKRFIVAAKSNDLSQVKQLLVTHGFIDFVKSMAMYEAVKSHGSLEMIQFLLRVGASASPIVIFGQNCLHLATEMNKLELVDLFVRGKTDLNVVEQINYDTALDIALNNDHEEIGRILLRSDARTNDYSDKDKYNRALRRAVDKGSVPFIELFLRKGANPNFASSKQSQPSFYESFKLNDASVFDLFLNHGADLNIKLPYSKKSSLQLAVEMHLSMLVEKILSANVVDVNGKNTRGLTPLHVALEGGRESRECFKIVKLLIEHGADVNATAKTHGTPLSFVVQVHALRENQIRYRKTLSRCEALFKLLLDNGAKFPSELTKGLGKIISAMIDIKLYADFNWTAKILLEQGFRMKDSLNYERYNIHLLHYKCEQKCLSFEKELERMKSIKICDHLKTTYYDFLMKRGYGLVKCLEDEDICNALESASNAKTLKWFSEKLENNYRRGLHLREIQSTFQKVSGLPYDLIILITDQLKDYDLYCEDLLFLNM